jgi:hypothetical protein
MSDPAVRNPMSSKRIVLLIGIGCLCLCLATCEKCGITEPESEIPVTLTFDVYSHMNGYEMTFSTEVMSGSDVIIKISDLGIAEVDENRIAIRDSNFQDLFVFGNKGEATIAAPDENARFNIVLFNTIPGLDYDMMDRQSAHLYSGNRHYLVNRKDNDGCPKNWQCGFGQEKPWKEAFAQFNETLDRGWIRWGSFQRNLVTGDEQGDFSYGYGDSRGFMGWHTGTSVTINACLLSEFRKFLAIGNAEIFENVTCADNNGIDGSGGSYDVVTDARGNLNEIGKHLLVYVFAKDSAPLN